MSTLRPGKGGVHVESDDIGFASSSSNPSQKRDEYELQHPKRPSISIEEGDALPSYNLQEDNGLGVDADTGDKLVDGPANKDDILTHTIHVEDDTSLNALTFRTWFLGRSRGRIRTPVKLQL